MTPTFTGCIARVEGMRADTSALAGATPKLGAVRVEGSGTIVQLAILGESTPAVVVDGVGTVPLAHVRDVDGDAVDLDTLSAWWWRELAAWVTRHGGDGTRGGDDLIAEAKRLRRAP